MLVMLRGEGNKSALLPGADGDVRKVAGVLNKSEEHRNFIVHPNFSVNITDVGFYGTMFYVQFPGNFFVA